VELVDHPQIETLQVPFNLLDQRLRRAKFFERAKAARKEVFVRSVFLQGLAFLSRSQLDPYLEPLSVLLGVLDSWARDHELSRAGLFLRYAQAQGVHLVLGCESAQQLRQNLATWRLGALAADQVPEVEALVPELPARLLNPAQWQLSNRS
jgi:aryl-alcohol dehydrogenase-like predicted oxidoreductase